MPRKFKAILAPFAALAMVFAFFVIPAGASASSQDDGTETQVPNLEPAGWYRSGMYARYHGPDENGKVTIWSVGEDGSGFFIKALTGPNEGWESFASVDDGVSYPAVMKLKRCGEKTKVELNGRYLEWYTIPPWPCKAGAATKVKAKVKSLRVVRPSATSSRASAGRTLARGIASPASKVKRVKVAVRKNGKRITAWRTARGKAKWCATFRGDLKPDRYTVTVRVLPVKGRVVTTKRTFRVR